MSNGQQYFRWWSAIEVTGRQARKLKFKDAKELAKETGRLDIIGEDRNGFIVHQELVAETENRKLFVVINPPGFSARICLLKSALKNLSVLQDFWFEDMSKGSILLPNDLILDRETKQISNNGYKLPRSFALFGKSVDHRHLVTKHGEIDQLHRIANAIYLAANDDEECFLLFDPAGTNSINAFRAHPYIASRKKPLYA